MDLLGREAERRPDLETIDTGLVDEDRAAVTADYVNN